MRQKSNIIANPIPPYACLLSKTFSSIVGKDEGRFGVSSTAGTSGK